LTESGHNILENLNVEVLLHMVQQLPPAYKMVFNLYAIEGYSHKEISKMLNITEGTSKSNLSKARMKLQDQLVQLQTSEKHSYEAQLPY
jgi:RNA polymerase sigma-70 factor (ECF subfamily)